MTKFSDSIYEVSPSFKRYTPKSACHSGNVGVVNISLITAIILAIACCFYHVAPSYTE